MHFHLVTPPSSPLCLRTAVTSLPSQFKHMLLGFGLQGRASPKAGYWDGAGHPVQVGELSLPTGLGHRAEDGARAVSAAHGDRSTLSHCESDPRM